MQVTPILRILNIYEQHFPAKVQCFRIWQHCNTRLKSPAVDAVKTIQQSHGFTHLHIWFHCRPLEQRQIPPPIINDLWGKSSLL